MTDITEQKKALTVSEAMTVAKTALESCTLTLVGEVSEVSNKPGYKAVYFTVKDEGASLPAMMWMNRFHTSGVDLTVGMLVQLTGRFTLYAPKGRMNFDVFSLALAGEGDLRQRVANLAKKLAAEGLMDPSRKRALPAFPSTIGLVTSPRGAAVHDVLRTLRRRFPVARIVLAGVPVEGTQAPTGLIEGLKACCDAGAELVLLVRGGGSFEDLMPFNDEALARSIAACPVPVATGIGHEPDNSIADMVADLRASTPTAAAEASVPDWLELSAQLEASKVLISKTLRTRIEHSYTRLAAQASRPVLHDPQWIIAAPSQALDINFDRLQRAIPANLARDDARLQAAQALMLSNAKKMLEPAKARLAAQASRLNDLSPLSVLGRGFSLAKNKSGALVKNVGSVSPGDPLYVSVSDGTITCRVEGSELSHWEVIPWKEDK